ncbi:MAG: GNAT family N-acetyltransferase [Acholeplasmatales bacterium]|nr:GNAT family N-acetyltransferase [Acholeplasmatales bacterium]
MKAIRVDSEWQKALVYYIRYEFIKDMIKKESDRKDFFTVEWEFGNDKPTDRYILVLDDNDNPVSTVRFLIDDNNYGLVERVRTLPTAERKGYGKEAMLEAERWLYDLGVRRVFVEAIPPALDFYKKVGYSFSNDLEILRNHNDLLLMEKDL